MKSINKCGCAVCEHCMYIGHTVAPSLSKDIDGLGMGTCITGTCVAHHHHIVMGLLAT